MGNEGPETYITVKSGFALLFLCQKASPLDLSYAIRESFTDDYLKMGGFHFID